MINCYKLYHRGICWLLTIAIVLSMIPVRLVETKNVEAATTEIAIDLSGGLAGAVYTGTTEACIYSVQQGYGYSDNTADWTDWKGAKDASFSDTNGVFYISKGGTYRITTGGINILGNIVIKSDEEVTLILDNVNMTGSRSIYRLSPHNNNVNTGLAAIDIQGNTVCNIMLPEATVNTLRGTSHGARLRNAAAISVENLYIQDYLGNVTYNALATVILDGKGTLNATGVECTAAIGGNDNRLTGNIIVNGGIINATSGNWGAAIGDGDTIDSTHGAQYISKWYCQDFTVNGYFYGKNVNQARIQINAGYVTAKATTATPAIGTSDQLSQASGYPGKEWDGMVIDIEGGTLIAIGGGQHDTAAIGVGNFTKINPANIIINQNGNTKILALTQQGGYPIIADAYTAGALPAMSGDSTATVLNFKFSSRIPAEEIAFLPMVNEEFVESEDMFPNDILSTLDISSYGISVVLAPNTYKIEMGNDEEIVDIPEGGGMIVGSQEDDGLNIKLPPTITSPNSVVVAQSNTAIAQYQATGTAAAYGYLTFQWQVSTDNGVSWANIPTSGYTTSLNGNTSTLTVTVGNSNEKNGYQYRCVLTETVSASDIRYATSGAAALTVTGGTLYDITISVFKNDTLWNDNNQSIYLYKDESLYTSATPSIYTPAIYNAKAESGEYKIYAGNEYTGVSLNVNAMSVSNIAQIYYYDVNLILEGMEGNNSVSIGASTYTTDGEYDITVLKNKTFTVYGKNTNTTNLKSDIYRASDAGYTLTDSDKSNMLSDRGYTISAVTAKKDVYIGYKRQHKAEVDVYLDPTSTGLYSSYLWSDYSDIGAYNKTIKLYRSSDKKEYTLSKVSAGVYQTNEWVFEGDTFDVYADAIDTNINITVTAASQLGVLRYYTLSFDPYGGEYTGLPGKTAYLANTKVDISNVIPIFEKYNFIGWEVGFSGVIAGDSITMDGPKNLFAMWELAPTEGTGKWKLIDGTSTLSVRFNDEINLKGKVYIYDAPELTKTYYVTGDNTGNLMLEGSADYYYADSKVSMKSYGATDTSEIIKNGEVIDGEFDKISVAMQWPEYVQVYSGFTVTHDTTYYMLKIERTDYSSGTTNITYLPIKVEPEIGNVEIRAFQMNTNSSEGAVSEFNPSFRVVSRAGKVMADKTGRLRTVSKYGTVYALDSKVNSDYDGLMKTDELGDNTGDVRHYEADDVGTLQNWSGSVNDADRNEYYYYALTFMSTTYYLNWLNTDYALTAYAVLDNGEVVYDTNDVRITSIYSIAKTLYENKKMPTSTAHEYLYDNVLNIVAINGNEKAIANAVRNALGGGSVGTDVYTYANNLYRDLYYYAQLAGNYNYENYMMRGKFTSNSMVGEKTNEELLLAALNTAERESNVIYDSVAQWISENTDYFYEEKIYGMVNSSESGTYE